jgi:hypothetical protein
MHFLQGTYNKRPAEPLVPPAEASITRDPLLACSDSLAIAKIVQDRGAVDGYSRLPVEIDFWVGIFYVPTGRLFRGFSLDRVSCQNIWRSQGIILPGMLYPFAHLKTFR